MQLLALATKLLVVFTRHFVFASTGFWLMFYGSYLFADCNKTFSWISFILAHHFCLFNCSKNLSRVLSAGEIRWKYSNITVCAAHHIRQISMWSISRCTIISHRSQHSWNDCCRISCTRAHINRAKQWQTRDCNRWIIESNLYIATIISTCQLYLDHQ